MSFVESCIHTYFGIPCNIASKILNLIWNLNLEPLHKILQSLDIQMEPLIFVNPDAFQSFQLSCSNIQYFKPRFQVWYRSIITSLLHASPRVIPHAVHVESAKGYRGKLHFHVTGRGFSTRRLMAFHDTWYFHETSRGISTRPVAVEFPRDQ